MYFLKQEYIVRVFYACHHVCLWGRGKVVCVCLFVCLFLVLFFGGVVSVLNNLCLVFNFVLFLICIIQNIQLMKIVIVAHRKQCQ